MNKLKAAHHKWEKIKNLGSHGRTRKEMKDTRKDTYEDSGDHCEKDKAKAELRRASSEESHNIVKRAPRHTPESRREAEASRKS